MLSRVAEAIFWMSRYLERTENIGRFIDVNWRLTLDLAEEKEQWLPLVMITGDHKDFVQRYDSPSRENVLHYLIMNPDYPNSVISCLRMARENARTVREIIPTEMWEEINAYYHYSEQAALSPESVTLNPGAFCHQIKLYGQILGGISLDSMAHDEAWRFFSLGRMLERADKTSRILDVKYFILLPSVQDVGSALDYIQWTSLLKATSSHQAYRHRHGRIVPSRVAEFLMLDREFPRSVFFSLIKAQQRLHEITGTRVGQFSNPAEKYLGQLCAELSYTSIEEILKLGLHEFTDNLQTHMNDVGKAIFDTFFSVFPAIDVSAEQ